MTNLKEVIEKIKIDKLSEVEQIKIMIPFLLKKDQPIAKLFIETRKFDDLLELVKSQKKIINKRIKRNDEEAMSIDLDAIDELLNKVENYARKL